MTMRIMGYNDFIVSNNRMDSGQVKITPDLSMEDLYKLNKKRAFEKNFKEAVDIDNKAVEDYLDLIMEGTSANVALEKIRKKPTRKTRRVTIEDSCVYDKEVSLDDNHYHKQNTFKLKEYDNEQSGEQFNIFKWIISLFIPKLKKTAKADENYSLKF